MSSSSTRNRGKTLSNMFLNEQSLYGVVPTVPVKWDPTTGEYKRESPKKSPKKSNKVSVNPEYIKEEVYVPVKQGFRSSISQKAHELSNAASRAASRVARRISRSGNKVHDVPGSKGGSRSKNSKTRRQHKKHRR